MSEIKIQPYAAWRSTDLPTVICVEARNGKKLNERDIEAMLNSHSALLTDLKLSQLQLQENLKYISKWNPNDIRNTSLAMQIAFNEKAIARADGR